MASGMKYGLLILAACAAVWLGISAIDLPPLTRHFGAPESADLNRMRAEIAKIGTTMRRYTVADSIARLLETTTDPVALAYDSSPGIAATVTAQLGTETPRARTAVLMLPMNVAGARRGVSVDPSGTEYIFNPSDDAPSCAAVHYKGPPLTGTAVIIREKRLLGPCMFWGRYGRPGPRIEVWLLKGGYRYADAPANSIEEVYGDFEPAPRRLLFGLRPRWEMQPVAGERCMAGRRGACAEAMLDSTSQLWRRDRTALPEAPPAFVRESYGNTAFGALDAEMLAMLENRFGREAFAKFWRSEQQVEPAFEAAFGASLDEWVGEWVQATYGKTPVGPRMSLATQLLSLLTVGLLLGAALQIVRRREVR